MHTYEQGPLLCGRSWLAGDASVAIALRIGDFGPGNGDFELPGPGYQIPTLSPPSHLLVISRFSGRGRGRHKINGRGPNFSRALCPAFAS